jgi:hypothetical protein
MATDLKEMAQSLSGTASELARRWAVQRVGAVQSYSKIIGDYGAGQASWRATAEAVARLAADEAARYPADAFKIWSDYISAVTRTAGLSLTTAGEAVRRTKAVLDIELTGKLGSTATRDFVLENPHKTDVKIGFAPSNFKCGETELKSLPRFDPVEFSLPAGGEHKVSVAVKLDRRKFKVGESYSANVAVSGFDDMVLRVHVTVVDPD